MSAKQKIRLYNSCVVSVLLDAAKTWGITQADKKRFDAFDSRCLGGISNVKWHPYVGNIEFQERTRKENIMDFLTREWLWRSDHLVSEAGWYKKVLRDRFASPGFPAHPETQQRVGEVSRNLLWALTFQPVVRALGQGFLLNFYGLEDVVGAHWPGWERQGGKEVNRKVKTKDAFLQDAALQQKFSCESRISKPGL